MAKLLPALKTMWMKERPGLFMVNRKHRLAFLIIPKNASTSMREVLDPWILRNARKAPNLKEIVACVTFGIVRDPLRRLVSGFSEVDQRVRNGPEECGGGRVHPVALKQRFIEVSDPNDRFRQFVRDVGRGIFDNHLVPQVMHVRTARVEIDEWLVHEKLKTDLPAFMKRHGLSGTIPYKKHNPHVERNRRYLKMLKTEAALKKIVRDVYGEDIEMHREVSNARVG